MCKGVAKPFLKWAGGKGQLLNKFEELYPQELIYGKIETYIEAFVGGGSCGLLNGITTPRHSLKMKNTHPI